MLGDPEDQKITAGLNAALVDAITGQARRQSNQRGRLVPPLLAALDEVPNIAPIPTLPSLMSTGGGSGICTMAVFQSVAQPQEIWGRELGTSLIRDLATHRIVLGGLGDSDALKELSALLGERDELTRSVSRRGGDAMFHQADVSTSSRLRPVLSQDEIRQLSTQSNGEALIIPRSSPGVIVNLPNILTIPVTKGHTR